MKFHPYSEIFPLIEGAEFDALVEDIKTHGLREKIWVYEGKILDGRNRFLACQKAKVRPQFRKFTGKDALAFIISLNVARRHLSEAQRAMAAARIATLKRGANQHEDAPRGASSQSAAAEKMDVSRRSVQRARQVIEKGSKALQSAVESGEIPLKRAAEVTNLPKAEQMQAAVKEHDEPERPEWEADEDAKLEAAEREATASIEKVMKADDKLAAAHAEIKRQAAEIGVLKLARDGYMNGKTVVTKLLKAEQRKVEKLERLLKQAEGEVEKLRERISIMEAA